jgi:hypothetical protein
MSLALPTVTASGRDASGAASRLLIFAIGFQIALLAPSLLAYALDERLINDVNIWTKPLKFQISLVLTLGTLLWLLPLLDGEWLHSRLVRFGAFLAGFFAVVEIAYITLQSARGRASHFNYSTPFESAMYSIMGVGAVSIVLGCFLIGLAIWLARRGENGFSLGAAIGLMLGAVLTLATAFPMSSGALPGQVGHWIGGVPSDAGTLPLVGWSRAGGDLRVAHFFGTHAMQALPLLGLIADRLAPDRARPIVWGGAALAILVTVATFLQAVAGRPFLG